MANRKVLINRHTTGSTAPTASEMYLGEIAVAHKTGEEIIWTKNNAGEMVPFITCAQTINIVSGMIEDADVTYDVQAAANDAHVEVQTGGTDSAKVFTVSSKDVESEEEFKAYSAATKTRIDNNVSAITDLTAVVSALTDVVLTGISGDSIIVAEILNPSTGANYVALTHRTGDETSGFNKLSTDAYGHVTGHTAVATEDIQALGFKTSAETDEEIAELSASVVTNKSNIEALSAGTIALSGDVVEYVKVVSGNIETVINSLSAGTIQLSADTHNAIAAAIEALDSETAVTAGKYLTGIAIADGKISGITEADLPTLSVESAGTGNVVSQITVNDHKITYQTISVATSEDIQALSASVINLSAATTAISEDLEELSGITEDFSGYTDAKFTALSAGTIQLSADTKATIEQLSAGTIQLSGDVVAYVNQISGYAHGEIVELSGAVKANETDIDNLSAATLDLSAVTLTGVSLNNTPLTVTDHVVSVPVTTSGSGIANATDSGSVADAKAVKEYVQDVLSSSVDYKGATDDVPSGTPDKGDLWIASSAFTVDGKNVEVGDFIIYNGSSWDVIEKNLDGAITGNLTQNTITLGDSTNSVKSLANGSNGEVLAIVNGQPAWTDDVKMTSAITSDSAITSLSANSADTALHADAATKVDSALTINVLTSAGTTADTVTFDGHENVTLNIPGSHDTATTEEGHYVPATAASAFTAPAGSFLSGVSVDSKNHVLAVAYADKINSATTSESADTAAKVANALSISGYSSETAATLDTAISYDGSAAQALTFGTVGNAGLNSMSMTNAGVVDVEVIDCGEY